MPFLMSLLQLNKLLQIQDACLGGLVLEKLPPFRYFLLNIFTQCLSSLFWTSQASLAPVLICYYFNQTIALLCHYFKYRESFQNSFLLELLLPHYTFTVFLLCTFEVMQFFQHMYLMINTFVL